MYKHGVDDWILDETELAEHYKDIGKPEGYESKMELVGLLEQLKEYKQLEEQGRLIKLPYKLGDTVWQIMVVGVQGKNIKYGIFKAVVTTISVDYQMNFLLSTITEDEERYRNEVTSTAIGETMFFTKSEAEQKLKEMESD